MYEQLNIYILEFIKRVTLLLFSIITLCGNVRAQQNDSTSFIREAETEVKIMPLKSTTKRPWIVDLYATGGIKTYSYSNLWTANNDLQIGYNTPDLGALAWNLGVDGDFYKTYLLQFGLGVGYENVRLAYGGKKISSNSGIHNHYLFVDASINSFCFSTGIIVHRLLGTQVPTEEKFDYVGLYPTCFNDWYAQWYFAAKFNVAAFRIEARMVMFMSPVFDTNKLAYYNMNKGYHDAMLAFEVKASYRFFTNKRKHLFFSVMDF